MLVTKSRFRISVFEKQQCFGWEASLTDAEPGCDGGSSSMEVRAELTATVWKVVVEQGATVAEGDELVILESMKMEIPVVAPLAGTVKELCVGEEDRIREGDVVAVIDPS